MEPPMNADAFARFISFRLRIERRVTDNLFIPIELFAEDSKGERPLSRLSDTDQTGNRGQLRGRPFHCWPMATAPHPVVSIRA
jgi:hypothetical protein